MPDEGGHNFGDYLMQLIGEGIYLPVEWSRLQNSSCCKYVLLGSFICDHNLNLVAEQNKYPVIVGCGYRGEVLSPRLVSQSSVLGCRGKHSQVALAEVGVNTDWVGDPAVILPLLIKKRRGKARDLVFMPHINDPLRLQIKPTDIGCDRILQPSIQDMAQLKEAVREISGASFVLAGSMHAAIIAYAYGVPFAFYATEGGYRDCPPKWADWLSSISSPYVTPAFFSDAAGGMNWYQQNMKSFHPPKYVPILKQYAAIGKLRRNIVWRAILHDAWQMYKGLVQAVPMVFSAPAASQKVRALSGSVILNSNSEQLISRDRSRIGYTSDRL